MATQGLVRIMVAFFILFLSGALCAEEGSVSMSLIKTAEGPAGKPRVKTQVHVVKKGEHLWKILRKRGLLDSPRGRELVEITMELNKDKRDLNLLRAGDRILIPVIDEEVPPDAGKKAPSRGDASKAPESDPEKARVTFEIVKVRPGQSLIGIIEARYKLSHSDLHNRYLPKFRELNPHIKDINIIVPGQRLKLPVPETLEHGTANVVSASSDEDKPDVSDDGWRVTSSSLARIFSSMGEEWIDKGRHFLPLQAGGQIELEADLFPLLSMSTGIMVLIDLKGSLPPRMARLIEESWGNYRVVGLGAADPLQALGRILPLCGFEKVLGRNESFKVSDVPELYVSGLWTVVYPSDSKEETIKACVISDKEIPGFFKDYLEAEGIRWLDITGRPPLRSAKANGDVMLVKDDPHPLVEEVLSMTGMAFDKRVKVPLERGRKGEFSFELTTDYLVHLKGRKAVLDLTGLGADIEALLKEKGYAFLSLAGEKDHQAIVRRMLAFLEIPFLEGRQEFSLLPDSGVRLAARGMVFADKAGKKVFLTEDPLDPPIASMLGARKVRVARIGLTQEEK
jgi:LysM repeat protein